MLWPLVPWSDANTNNGSNVSFGEMTDPGPAQITIETGTCSNGKPACAVITTENGVVIGATIKFDPAQLTVDSVYLKTALHEIGHTMGLNDQPADPQAACGAQVSGGSVMNGLCGSNDSVNNMPTSVTGCDQSAIINDPTYNPCGSPPEGCLLRDDQYCYCVIWDEDPPGNPCSGVQCTCGSTCNPALGYCEGYSYECSPIMIAVGNGSSYKLTSPAAGVDFDLNADGIRERMAWTRVGDEVAFLVLDRNLNGRIDDGTELFGNKSIVPSGQPVTNGFEALAHYDRAGNGGNGDGVIDSRDVILSALQLWIDWNHDGLSEPFELYALSDWELSSISLDFRTIHRQDGYGNVPRLQAPCQLGNKTRFGYDVFFSAKPQKRPN